MPYYRRRVEQHNYLLYVDALRRKIGETHHNGGIEFFSAERNDDTAPLSRFSHQMRRKPVGEFCGKRQGKQNLHIFKARLGITSRRAVCFIGRNHLRNKNTLLSYKISEKLRKFAFGVAILHGCVAAS